MTEEKTTRELVYETNRDVKWICQALQRMEAQDAMVRECDCRPGRSLSTEGARTGAGAPSGTTFPGNGV